MEVPLTVPVTVNVTITGSADDPKAVAESLKRVLEVVRERMATKTFTVEVPVTVTVEVEEPAKPGPGHRIDDENIAKIREALALLDSVRDLSGGRPEFPEIEAFDESRKSVYELRQWQRYVAFVEAERDARAFGWTVQPGPTGDIWTDTKGVPRVVGPSFWHPTRGWVCWCIAALQGAVMVERGEEV